MNIYLAVLNSTCLKSNSIFHTNQFYHIIAFVFISTLAMLMRCCESFCCENVINFCLLNHTDFSSLHSRCPMLKCFTYSQWASFSWHKSSPQPHCSLNILQNILYSFQGNSTPSPYKAFLLCTWKKKKNICSWRTTLFFPPLFMENLL